MRKFASAVILMIVGSLVATAQTKTYEVKSGDTFDGIANKFGVSHDDLVRANSIANSHKLKLGQKLLIPKPSAGTKTKAAELRPGHYRVRNGDQDWAIAARFNIKPSELRKSNPGVNWTRLQIGQILKVPSQGSTIQPLVAGKAAPRAQVASNSTGKKSSPAKWSFPTTAYAVRKGDNDWTIAHRFGIGLTKFKALNPKINTAKLHPGQYVRVPGTTGTILAVSSVIRSRYAVVVKDGVIVRRGAGIQTEKITTVDSGTRVDVLDRQNGWYKLRFPRGTVGWVRGDMLKAVKSAPMLASNTKSRSSGRSYVATHYRPTKQATRNKRTTGSNSGSGTFAFKNNGSGNGDIVSNAMSMLGARYRYGSASRGATDCSGLVLQAAKGAGVKLPRTSAQMSKVGTSVSKGELKPGDLVFFRTRGSRVSHVGVYKGNGQFVHASSGKGYVTVSSLNEGYYSRAYAGAKRVAGSSSKKTSAKKPEVAKEASKVDVQPKSEEKPAEKPVTRNTDEINP